MVKIRRSTPRLRSTGKASKSPSRSLIGYAPVLLMALVAVYGIFIFMTLSGTANNGSVRGAFNGPKGVADVLQNSNVHRPKKNFPQKEATPAKDLASLADSNPDSPKQRLPAPQILSNSHHLEEPDIHMHHPGPPSEKGDTHKAWEPRVENVASDSRGAPIHHVVLDKRGTGATNVAYVRDFELERVDPEYRHQLLQEDDTSAIVARLVQESKVSECKSLEQVGGSDRHRHWTIQEPCLDPDTPQIAYNPGRSQRVWCGQEIAPQSAVTMSEHCSDPTVHLFPVETPPATGRGMPPMIIKSSAEPVKDVSTLQSVECDIPCLKEPGLEITEGDDKRYFEGEPWTMTQTMADSYNNFFAKIERINYRKDLYYSTQSFKSSVPLTYYDPEKFSLRNRPAISYDDAKPKALYMVDSICASPGSKRQKYFAAISNAFPVDSMGNCHHTADVPEGMTINTMEGRIELMKQYRFVLALERTKEKDHISPMVWEALISGTVPVIVGADNLRLHLPPHSYIDSAAYNGWDELAVAVKRINGNKEEWESYHKWRTDEVALAKFEELYEFAKTNPMCRLCRWAYSKKYGLGWDQVKQRVTDTRLPRNLCTTSAMGLVSKPFQEEWISRNEDNFVVVNLGANPGTEECGQSLSVGPIDNGSTYKIQRTLTEHDGITDILVTDIERESTQQELVLRLHFPGVHNSDGAHFQDTHTAISGLKHKQLVSSASMQDELTKVTVLADWVTSISCPKDGVLEVVVVEAHENEEQPSKPLSPNIPKRIRVITEDIRVIHDKMTEYFPSSFAAVMVRDFVDPLEVYYANG